MQDELVLGASDNLGALVTLFEGQGFSRLAAEEAAKQAIGKASAKIAAQRKVLAAQGKPYQQWLSEVSPEMVWNKPVHTVLCDHMDRIARGDLRQLAIFMPPRLGKSQAVTIRFPVYMLERNPSMRVIVGGYNKDLASFFAAESMRLFRQRNPKELDKTATEEWTTTSGGGVLAVGVGSGVTGRGADLMIIDDPVKSREEAVSSAYQMRVWNWWLHDMRTRRNQLQRTPTILIMTRWTDLDLAGRILEQDTEKGLWTVLSLPALALENDPLGRAFGESIWPERLPEDELEQTRVEMMASFDAMYQQDPAPAEGSLIKDEWFWYHTVDEQYVVARCRFWDLAASEVSRKNSRPDYTAGVRMCMIRSPDNRIRYAIEDVRRLRALPGERDDIIVETAIDDGMDCAQYFEEGDDGDKAVTAALRKRLPGYAVIGSKPRRDKIVRSTNFRSSLQKGEIFLVRGRWNGDYIHELIRFPVGRHDDQVDGSSGAFDQLVINSLQVSIR